MTLTVGSTRQPEERLGEMADKWGPTICEYKHARGRGVISYGAVVEGMTPDTHGRPHGLRP